MEEKDIVKKLAAQSGIGLIITAAVSLIVVAVLKGWYFYQIFEHFRSQVIAVFLPVAIAIASQMIRFVFLLSSAKDLGRGNMLGATLGGIASIGMIIYEISEATHWVDFWSVGNAGVRMPLFYAFCFLILAALFCEARLCIALLPEKYTMRKAETVLRAQLEEKEKTIVDVTDKMRHLFAYKAEIEAQKQAKTEEEERQRQAAKQKAEQEKDRELRRLQELVKDMKEGVKLTPTSREGILQAAKEFVKENGRVPTQAEIAETLSISARTVRNQFPNGSWQTSIL